MRARFDAPSASVPRCPQVQILSPRLKKSHLQDGSFLIDFTYIAFAASSPGRSEGRRQKVRGQNMPGACFECRLGAPSAPGIGLRARFDAPSAAVPCRPQVQILSPRFSIYKGFRFWKSLFFTLFSNFFLTFSVYYLAYSIKTT